MHTSNAYTTRAASSAANRWRKSNDDETRPSSRRRPCAARGQHACMYLLYLVSCSYPYYSHPPGDHCTTDRPDMMADWDLEGLRVADFARQGVHTVPTGAWRLDLSVNKEFALCGTYPRMLAVPARATPEHMHAVAPFRGRRRLPVLCYRSPVSGAALVRGAQPRPGLLQKRSAADERWVELVFEASGGRPGRAPATPSVRIRHARA